MAQGLCLESDCKIFLGVFPWKKGIAAMKCEMSLPPHYYIVSRVYVVRLGRLGRNICKV